MLLCTTAGGFFGFNGYSANLLSILIWALPYCLALTWLRNQPTWRLVFFSPLTVAISGLVIYASGLLQGDERPTFVKLAVAGAHALLLISATISYYRATSYYRSTLSRTRNILSIALLTVSLAVPSIILGVYGFLWLARAAVLGGAEE